MIMIMCGAIIMHFENKKIMEIIIRREVYDL